MKLYLIVYEDGEYSDWMTYVESIHWTYQDALDELNNKPVTLAYRNVEYSPDLYDDRMWYDPVQFEFSCRHCVPEGEYTRITYDNIRDGYVWMLDEKYYIDAIWYIVEKEIDPPKNVAYICDRNEDCSLSPYCIRNSEDDPQACFMTTNIEHARNFYHLGHGYYAEKVEK